VTGAGELSAALIPTEPRQAETPAGRLSGARLAVKDVIDVAGSVTGEGNPDWASAQPPAGADAAAVAALLGAGAELAGKGQCAELAFSLSGDNVHYGMPVNGAAPDRDPGGSTSGPAALVSAGLADLGLGTDTLGSIRVPASYCGLYGYRPTFGTIDTAGVLPLAQPFDTVGLLARDPELLARAASQLLGVEDLTEEPPRRLLHVGDPPAEELARKLDATLEPAAPLPDLAEALDAFSVIQGAYVWRNFGAWIEGSRPSLGADVQARIERAAAITPDEVAAARPVAASVREAIARLNDDEALVLPTAGGVAPARDADPDARQTARLAAGRLTCIASLAGAPSVSMPLTESDGLPLGIALVGPPGVDGALLAALSSLRTT
jgi:amidase